MLEMSFALKPISSSDWWSIPASAFRPLRSWAWEAEKASYCAIIAGEKAPEMSIRPPVKSNSLASKPGAVSWECERLGSEAKE